VEECLLRGDTLVRIALQHLVKQVQTFCTQGHLVSKGLGLVLDRLILREKWQFFEARPVLLGRGATRLENLLQLFFFVIARKERLVVYDLSEDATHRPNVH